MATEADRLLIELAVKNHLISAEEGQSCLNEVPPAGDVGAVLLEKRMLKERHLKSLRKKLSKILEERGATPAPQAPAASAEALTIQETPPAPAPLPGASDQTFVTPDASSSPLLSAAAGVVFFGQLALQRHLVQQQQLDQALRYQEQLSMQGRPLRIGQILVQMGAMTADQVRQVLEFQELWVYTCGVCQRRFNVSTSQELAGPNLRCGACGGTLLHRGGSSISVAGTHAAQGGGTLPAPLPPSQPASSSQRKPPSPDDPAGLLGLVWKGYRVDRVLGKGGMGAVYAAEQVSLKRPVALKVMLRGSTQAAPGERERFEREAKLVGRLSYPGIVRVFDAEWEEGLCWFTMELVPGKDFKQTLRTGQFPMRKGAEVVAKVARAMDFAHKRGIIHRDLKPQNVMIEEGTGEPKILDFGLAKQIVDHTQIEQLTEMGAFLGTPAYMAPEQAGGDPNAVDHRADVYALGAILYEVLTGRPPFTGKKAIQVIRKVLKEDPVPCREVFAAAPAELEAIAMQALSKRPEDRQPDAATFASQIEAVLGLQAPPQAQTSQEPAPPRKGFLGRLFGG